VWPASGDSKGSAVLLLEYAEEHKAAQGSTKQSAWLLVALQEIIDASSGQSPFEILNPVGDPCNR